MSPLINKEGFLQSDSSKNIPNDQFQSEYTQENTSSIPNKGPSPHPSMPRIKIGLNGVIKLLIDLNPHKAAEPDSIYILKAAAEEMTPVCSKIFQTSLDIGKIPEDWRGAHTTPVQERR